MDIPPETDSYLRQSIDLCVGLPVSTTTLETKLRVSQESHRRIHQQYLHLLAKFNHKDQQIQRIRVCYALFFILSMFSIIVILLFFNLFLFFLCIAWDDN